MISKGSEGVRIFTRNRGGIRASSTARGRAEKQATQGSLKHSGKHSATDPAQGSSLLCVRLATMAMLVLAPAGLIESAAWAQAPGAASASAPAVDTAQYGNAQALCTPQIIGNRAHSERVSAGAAVFTAGRPVRPANCGARLQLALEHGLFRVSADRARRHTACVQLVVYVKEKPTIRELNYKGINAVSLSDIADRFKKEKVGLTVESQYDPTRIKRAETVLKALLAEHGHQFATVKEEVKTIPPASVAVTFNIKEGPHG